MFESAIRIGTIAGIRIGVHYTWFIIFALITYSLNLLFQQRHPEWPGGQALTTALLTALLFFASIVLHELGHSLVAIRRGIPVRSITLFIFGGVAQTERDADSAATEFRVAIAGPLVSFALSLFFYLLGRGVEGISIAAAVAFNWLASINLAVAVFNLLPGFPLDGGRVFRALVWGFTGDAARGMRWAVASGRLVAYGLLLMGLLVVVTTGLLFNGLWLAAIGWFLLSAAEASGREFTLRHVLRNVRVRDVMRHDAPAVSLGLSVQDWIDQYVLASAQRAFLVEEDGKVVGLATLSDCAKLPRAQWSTTPLSQIMTPREHLHTVSPEAGLVQVLTVMERYSVNQVPVVSRGELIGWIDRDRVLKTVRLYSEVSR